MNNSQTPLVSVLMTAYNREKYIGEAIESVLTSTYTNFELIIVDDCSIDNTVQIAESYKEKEGRIRVYHNKKNLTDYPNRNRAAAFARGKFLIYVDSDDSIQADAIDYIVNEFNCHPDARFSLIYYHKDISVPTVLSSKESIKKHFFKKGFLNIGPGGTVIQNDYFKAIGGFPEKYGPANDLYYNLKVAANTNILLLPYIYLNYRVHEGQESNNEYSYLFNNHRYLLDVIELPELPLTKDERKLIIKERTQQSIRAIIRFLLFSANFRKAFEAYKKAGIRINDLF